MKELFELYLIFVKIGSIAFGGGYALLPILQEEFVRKRNWVSDEELMDYFAIGQCTPGIISVNVATFIGNKRKGVIGGFVTTFGFVTIPLLLISVIAMFLTEFASYPIVKNAFAGIRVVVCILILTAIERLWPKSITSKVSFALFLIVFVLSTFTDVSPILLVVFSGVTGVIISQMNGGKAK